jgi:hypothetical protein
MESETVAGDSPVCDSESSPGVSPSAVSHDHHKAIAARLASPDSIRPLSPRQGTRRCKNRAVSSSAAHSKHPASSSAPAVGHPPSATVDHPPSSTVDHPPSPAATTNPSSANGNTSNLPSFMVGTQTGQGTFYATGLGACGIVNKDTDYIAAVSHLLFDIFPGYNHANPNSNPLCGKKVTASYQGNSVTVILTDRCTGCKITDLDFSPSAFNQLADQSVGRISGMTWVWKD